MMRIFQPIKYKHHNKFLKSIFGWEFTFFVGCEKISEGKVGNKWGTSLYTWNEE